MYVVIVEVRLAVSDKMIAVGGGYRKDVRMNANSVGDDLNEGIQVASDGMIATECRIFVDVHTLVVIILVSRIFDFHFSFFQTYLSRWYWPKLFISSLTPA